MTLRSFSLLLVAALVGCNGGTTGTDAGNVADTGSPVDSGSPVDTGASDTGAAVDAGEPLVQLCTQICERQNALCGTHPDCTQCAGSASDPTAIACRSEGVAAMQCYLALSDTTFCDVTGSAMACATESSMLSACISAHTDAGM